MTGTVSTHRIGDQGPGGGIVFYVASAEQSWGTYLEATPCTWAGGSEDPRLTWSDRVAESIRGSSDTRIGAGAVCSAAVAAESEVGASVRVLTCDWGGMTDWFVPSKDELGQLCSAAEIVGDLAEGFYWSSSEFDKFLVWAQSFPDGFQDHFVGKANKCYVRPIRAF